MVEDEGTKDGKDGKPDPADGKTDPPGDTGSDTGSGDGKPDQESLRKLIREEIQSVLKGDGKDTDGKPPVSRRSVFDMEKEAERLVQEAAGKLIKDHEHEQEHKTLKDKVSKPVEDAPKKVRRITKALWGSDEK